MRMCAPAPCPAAPALPALAAQRCAAALPLQPAARRSAPQRLRAAGAPWRSRTLLPTLLAAQLLRSLPLQSPCLALRRPPNAAAGLRSAAPACQLAHLQRLAAFLFLHSLLVCFPSLLWPLISSAAAASRARPPHTQPCWATPPLPSLQHFSDILFTFLHSASEFCPAITAPPLAARSTAAPVLPPPRAAAPAGSTQQLRAPTPRSTTWSSSHPAWRFTAPPHTPGAPARSRRSARPLPRAASAAHCRYTSPTRPPVPQTVPNGPAPRREAVQRPPGHPAAPVLRKKRSGGPRTSRRGASPLRPRALSARRRSARFAPPPELLLALKSVEKCTLTQQLLSWNN